LISSLVLLADAKICWELQDKRKQANKKMKNALRRLSETIQLLFREIFITLSKTYEIRIDRYRNNKTIIEFEIGIKQENPKDTISELDNFIKHIGFEIYYKYYVPPRVQKEIKRGFFGKIWGFFFGDEDDEWEERERYKEEIRVWISIFLEEMSENQSTIGHSNALSSFLRRYSCFTRRQRNQCIMKTKGGNTNSFRIATLVLAVIVAICLVIWRYVQELAQKAQVAMEEFMKPRYQYLPPEIDDTSTIPETVADNPWIYNTIENILIAIGILFLIEFLFVELRTLAPRLKSWKIYLHQNIVSVNYLYPNAIVKNVTNTTIIIVLLTSILGVGAVSLFPDMFHYKKSLTHAEVLDSIVSLSPSEGALFYINNKENISFLDSLYGNTVLPAMEDCDYMELKKVRSILGETKYKNQIQKFMFDKRVAYLNTIKKEITENEKKEIASIDDYVIPSIEYELDSLIEMNVDDILDSYSGGILNFRKLAFLFGRDKDKFISIFNNDVNIIGYEKCVQDYALNYMYIINYQQDKYCKNFTDSAFIYKAEFKLPKPKMSLSNNTISFIQDYTSNEKWDIVFSGIRDYATPIVIAYFSGGASLIYDAATMTYDINEAINNTEISPEEIIKCLCEEDVAKQTIEFYKLNIRQQLIDHIKKSNNLLYKKIEKEL
jgi:hypothetical protein